MIEIYGSFMIGISKFGLRNLFGRLELGVGWEWKFGTI
jgi:hypothetical protein